MEVFLGTIMLFPYDFVPEGWEVCKGQKLAIMEHQPLYSLLANRFGGDGAKHFHLPDLKEAAPAPHLHYCISMNGTYPRRA